LIYLKRPFQREYRCDLSLKIVSRLLKGREHLLLRLTDEGELGLRLIVVIGWERLSREAYLPSHRMIAAKLPKLHSPTHHSKVILPTKRKEGGRNGGAGKSDWLPTGLAN
jgi:hypothetical protein